MINNGEMGKPFFPFFSTSRSILIKRTSITLDDRVYDTGLEIAAQRGFSQSFSAYIAWLIQRDAAGGVTREESPKAVKAGLKAAVKPKAKPKSKPKAAPKAKATPRAKAKATPAKPATRSRTTAAAGRKRSKTAR